MRCSIEGVVIRELDRRSDDRGWLVELFRADELEPGLHPAMGYISMTLPGVVRGPHEHRTQTDMFCFPGTSAFRLLLWDNRAGAATCGRSFQAEIAPDRTTVVIVPPGVVHAYKNIGNAEGLVFNVPNRLYRGEGRSADVDEIRHEDDPDSPFRIDD